MKKPLLILFAFVTVFMIASNFIPVNKNETLFYKLQQFIEYDQADWDNYNRNRELLTSTPAGSVRSDVETAAVSDELYPIDTNRATPEVKAAELHKIKKANFGSLKVAQHAPNNEEAQIALIHFTARRLTDVIIQQKLNIKVGTCFDHAKVDGNYRCVSCMILLYNREKNHWVEAPEGDNFLKNAYDFYQASEGDVWQARDLTMPIPFDYAVFKKYSAVGKN